MKFFLKKSLFVNKIIFYLGYIIFLITKRTPKLSYMAMVNLYCITNGHFLDRLHKRNSFSKFQGNSKLFKNLIFENIKEEVEEIKREGYKIFDSRLPSKVIKDLKSLSYTLNASIGNNQILFDPKNKNSNIYKFKPNDIIQNQWVHERIMDPVLINIAGTYLGADPIFDFAAMWWSTDSKLQKEDAAQEYHFDLDRPKWLKIFIYLTDVNKDNGPHCYISGTHKVGSKPLDILKKGYVRVADHELEKYYPKSNFKEITGPAGTIVFGDTGCWHKGKPIIKGDRLIFQLEYTSSLFGLNLPKFKIANPGIEFSEFCKNNKLFTKNIKLSN